MSHPQASPTSRPEPAATPVPFPSERNAVGWILLALVLIPGGWLLAQVQMTEGIFNDRLWNQFLADPALQFAGLDFFLTAGWVAIVMLERGVLQSPRFWICFAVFCAIPSLGVGLYVLIAPKRPLASLSSQA